MRFELRRLSEYSEEALISELRRVSLLAHQSKLSQGEFRKHSRVAPGTVSRRFGSWDKALKAAGLSERSSATISADDALLEVKRVAALIDKQKLTISSFEAHSRISPKSIIGHFGSWRKALESADLSGRFNSSSQRISRDETIAEINRVSELLGVRVLTIKQFEENSRFGANVARKRFGTWHEAMEAAGLSGHSRGKMNTDDECFENLLLVWTHYGRAPTQREMSKSPSAISAHAYAARFGGWIKALEAFIGRVNSDNNPAKVVVTEEADQEHPTSDLPSPIVGNVKTKKVRIPDCDKREIRLGLRYAVLNRDRFRCVICGRSPATTLGIVLHVDHKDAWSKGGKTVIENLRSTCSDCNLGKGSRFEG